MQLFHVLGKVCFVFLNCSPFLPSVYIIILSLPFSFSKTTSVLFAWVKSNTAVKSDYTFNSPKKIESNPKYDYLRLH